MTVTGRDSAPGSQPGTFTFFWTINRRPSSPFPDVRGEPADQATADLVSAGLQFGTIGGTVDCDNLKSVSSQTPAPGAEVARGSADQQPAVE